MRPDSSLHACQRASDEKKRPDYGAAAPLGSGRSVRVCGLTRGLSMRDPALPRLPRKGESELTRSTADG
jgi:hypothetical protein